ncbi:MAG: cryptochrome/photolyase family protein [Melioribacteraceae bacterium]|nr:cryptochrome/photolyase family protein [Melioribacteraceae bacterium]
MNEISLVFPHQLFEENPIINNRKVLLIEDPLFFGDTLYPASFHKKKIIFQRASLKNYEALLNQKKIKTEYLNYVDIKGEPAYLEKFLKRSKIDIIHFIDPVDFILEKRLNKLSVKKQIYSTPNFLCSKNYLEEYFSNKKTYFLNKFYIDERKRLGLLIDNSGNPLGGKWNLDQENRKSISNKIIIPNVKSYNKNKFIEEAINYTNSNFSQNPGSPYEFWFPTNHADAKSWFENFLITRFYNYGDYQDAILKNEHFLFHSLLSPLINNGLLNPNYVVERSIEFALSNNIPINSLEGFIRQIIGWREFIRGVYILDGVKQRNSNFFDNQNKIPKSFYDGTTGIEPIDITIKKLLDTSYNHHIERLMILSNFMLLCEFHPTEVYKWFMEMYIDSYDWVMVPNVYGMGQFADGGLMSTKPYISSSNYIKKMSDYKSGEWTKIWDALFWRFIFKHKDYFSKNMRTVFMAKSLERMDHDKLSNHIKTAEKFLNTLT